MGTTGSLGDLLIRLAADTAQFQTDMGRAAHIAEQRAKEIERSAQLIKRGLAAAFAGFSVKLVIDEFKRLADSAAALDDFSEKTGVSVANASRLQQIAAITGASFEGLETSLIKLNKVLQTNDAGFSDARRATEALGLSIEDLRKKDPALALEDIAKAAFKFADSQTKSAAATALLGKAGAQQLPFLKDYVTYGDQAAVVSGEQAAAAELLRNQMREVTLGFDNLKRQLVQDSIPAIREWITNVQAAYKEGGVLRATLVALGGVFDIAFNGSNNQQLLDQLAEVDAEIKKIKTTLEQDALSPGISDDLLVRRIGFWTKRLEELDARRKQIEASLGRTTEVKPDLDFQIGSIDVRAITNARDLDSRLNKVFQEGQLALAKDSYTRELAELELYHKAALVSDKYFYETRAKLAQDEAKKELAIISAQIEDQIKRRDEGTNILNKGRVFQSVPEINKGFAQENAAQQEIEKLLVKRELIERSVKDAAVKNFFESREAAEKYISTVTGLEIQLLALQGRAGQSAGLQFDVSNKDLLRRLEQNPDAAVSAMLETLRNATVQQAAFTEERNKFAEATARLGIEEQQVQNALKAGAISEYAALEQTGALRQAALEQYNRQIEALRAIVALTEDESTRDKLRLQLDDLVQTTNNLAASADLLGDRFKTAFEGAIISPLTDFITRTKEAGDAFRSFAQSVVRNIAEIAARQLAVSASSAISPFLGAALKGLLGGAAAAGGVTAAAASTSYAQSLVRQPATFVSGGSYAEGGSFIIPGSGGIDTSLVGFMGTPGEEVSIRTVEQQRAESVNPSPTIIMNNTFGSEVTTSTLALWARQIERTTILAVANATQRGGSFAGAIRG